MAACEQFLASAQFDRAPWLAVAFAGGISAWFILGDRWQWLALLSVLAAVGVGALALMKEDGRFPYMRQAIASLALVGAARDLGDAAMAVEHHLAFGHIEVERAARDAAAELQGISAHSCGVLQKMGPSIQWVESYVTDDKVYCVYIAPNESMVREHAAQGGFPANRVSEVKSIIDPTTAG